MHRDDEILEKVKKIKKGHEEKQQLVKEYELVEIENQLKIEFLKKRINDLTQKKESYKSQL